MFDLLLFDSQPPSDGELMYIEAVAELIAQAQGVHIFDALAELCES